MYYKNDELLIFPYFSRKLNINSFNAIIIRGWKLFYKCCTQVSQINNFV